jgi:DNA-binding CsgD family transcriptional regulator
VNAEIIPHDAPGIADELPLAAVARALLDHAGEPAGEPPGPEALRAMRVVLDLELEGVRYVLLREERRRAPALVSLSSRELEIARMIARGHTNRTIAAVLEISPWTVSTHLRRVFAKLDVSSRAAMVGVLTARGLIEEPAGRP